MMKPEDILNERCTCGLLPNHINAEHDHCCQICGGSHLERICPKRSNFPVVHKGLVYGRIDSNVFISDPEHLVVTTIGCMKGIGLPRLVIAILNAHSVTRCEFHFKDSQHYIVYKCTVPDFRISLTTFEHNGIIHLFFPFKLMEHVTMHDGKSKQHNVSNFLGGEHEQKA